MKDFLEYLKWIVTLKATQILKVIIAALAAGAGYIIYSQQQKIEQLDDRNNSLNLRYSNDIDLLQKAVEDCNKQRYLDVEKTANYWREKFERTEERSSVNYRNIQEIKENNK